MRIKSAEAEWVLKTKPAVSNRAYTDKTHLLEGVKEFLLDRALTFSSQNESISIVRKQNYTNTGITNGKPANIKTQN
jgi:hypothetical protein